IRDKLVTGVQTCALPISIFHASAWSLPEIGKLAEPSRHNRTQGTIRRKTQKGIAWAQLTILVTTANHVSPLQSFLLYRERHDVRSEERRVGKECRGRTGA